MPQHPPHPQDPQDPFAGDPSDPAAALGDDDDEPVEPLTDQDRAELAEDLADLDLFRTLLEPGGVRGMLVDCDDCGERHFFDWDLLVSNLRTLLRDGTPGVHEPAFAPDPDTFVSWDYARGYADGVTASAEDG